MASTTPSSSAELGTPSGPSLSNCPKSTAASCAATMSSMSWGTPEPGQHRPLQSGPPSYTVSSSGTAVQSSTVPFTNSLPFEISW